jgi:hypothetical protein
MCICTFEFVVTDSGSRTEDDQRGILCGVPFGVERSPGSDAPTGRRVEGDDLIAAHRDHHFVVAHRFGVRVGPQQADEDRTAGTELVIERVAVRSDRECDQAVGFCGGP